MDEFQAVLHLVFSQSVDSFQQFARVQAKLAVVAARLFPFSAARARQFDADSDVRTHTDPLCKAGNQVQFVELFHNEKYSASHLLRQQSQLHIVLVLVSIADNEIVLIDIRSEHSVQLRLRAGLQPDVEFLAVAHDFVDHLTHLVHLYRIDDKVLRAIFIFLCGLLEASRNLLDAIVEDIGETQQHRSGNVTNLQLVHQFFQIDGCTTFTRSHLNVTIVVD